jgi:HPt (histidine-containing phosphotransfer) domain-containing protein
MDMQMPVLDGVAATQEIRKTLPGPLPVIVAMTANAMPQHVEACMDAGMQGFVAKPIDPEHLWTTLIRWIAPRHTARALQTDAPGAASREASTPWLQKLSAIEGLDAPQGLRRVMGKEPSYLKMLRKFISGQRDTLRHTRDALEQGDWPTAERLAHTLKAVAGNIGASRVQADAAALEAVLHQRHAVADTLPLLEAASVSLDGLIALLVPQLPHIAVPADVSEADKERASQLIEQLKSLVRDDDAAALDLFADNAALLKFTYPDCYVQLDEALANYDFSAALAYLQKPQV